MADLISVKRSENCTDNVCYAAEAYMQCTHVHELLSVCNSCTEAYILATPLQRTRSITEYKYTDDS